MVMVNLKPSDIPADFPVRPLRPGDAAQDRVTDNACGLSWDDAVGTTWTPAPSGRCPFEYFHVSEEEEEEEEEPGPLKLGTITGEQFGALCDIAWQLWTCDMPIQVPPAGGPYNTSDPSRQAARAVMEVLGLELNA
jgi:hypothetical protein